MSAFSGLLNVYTIKFFLITGSFLYSKDVYVEEKYLLGGVYAKIYTDNRGIYFFTEGRHRLGGSFST